MPDNQPTIQLSEKDGQLVGTVICDDPVVLTTRIVKITAHVEVLADDELLGPKAVDLIPDKDNRLTSSLLADAVAPQAVEALTEWLG